MKAKDTKPVWIKCTGCRKLFTVTINISKSKHKDGIKKCPTCGKIN